MCKLTEVNKAGSNPSAPIPNSYKVNNNSFKVKTDCTWNELIRREPLGNRVCVIDYVATEKESANYRVDEVYGLSEWNDYSDKPSHDLLYVSTE